MIKKGKKLTTRSQKAISAKMITQVYGSRTTSSEFCYCCFSFPQRLNSKV